MNDQKKYLLFIVNPFAGHGSKAKIPNYISKEVNRSKYDFDIVYTKYSGHATEIAAKAKEQKVDGVISVGGDGTVNEVASALIYSETAMGIIPGGSGNGLSTHLGIGRNPKKALNVIDSFQTRIIDTATVNDKFYVNMAGVGIDGLVAYKTKQSAKRGFSTYLKGALTEAIKYKNQTYKVEIDGREIEGKFLSINVAYGSMFGYNFTIAADADTSDGLMDALMIHDARKVDYFGNAWRFWAGRIHKSKFASLKKTSEIKITSYDDSYMHIDGEGYPCQAGELEFKVMSQSLKMIC